MAKQTHRSDPANQKAQLKEQKIEIEKRLGHITHKILVMSKKGGVGKSSIAAYLAVVLAKRDYRVGLMDVDLHGPSIPRLLGLTGKIQPGKRPKTVAPIEYSPNLRVVSIETLVGDRDAAMIWRGPLKGGVIRQFIADVEWNDLDYMIIDSPPGTGDEPLTVAQTIPDAKAMIVTTPQEIALQMDPEVVSKGDIGDTSLLDNADRPITKTFDKMVDEILRILTGKKVPSIEPADLHAIG